ncbi:MAG: DNA polymerase IV [Rhizobiales bacterium]|nr:DNA polymerase IV [Hyphomicrobiales bacterium]
MAEEADNQPFALCRDCLSHCKLPKSNTVPGQRPRCKSCGSPRLLHHPELTTLTIAHIDCDAFYAAVEKRDNPSLVDKPVIIGGGTRGVVSTACYIARIRGVHSAQPMFKALALCPDAVVIRPDMEKYAKVGRAIRQQMLTLTPLVEPVSIDEAFLDLTGTERLHGRSAAETLAAFVIDIQQSQGISVSVGLSFNKFLAKIASDFEKPRGFSVIGRAEALGFLKDKPVSMIWGVGQAFRQTLARDGIHTIGELQGMNEATLARRYGAMGLRIARLARADDRRVVSPERETKSVSSETTFNTDLSDFTELTRCLRQLCEKVSRQLKAKALSGQTVVLKLKTTDFRSRTRSHKLADPTQLADRLFRDGKAMLERECDGTKFRLIGIGVSDLYPADIADPEDLIDEAATRRAKAERAIDKVRGKFGNDAVKLGLLVDREARRAITRPGDTKAPRPKRADTIDNTDKE